MSLPSFLPLGQPQPAGFIGTRNCVVALAAPRLSRSTAEPRSTGRGRSQRAPLASITAGRQRQSCGGVGRAISKAFLALVRRVLGMVLCTGGAAAARFCVNAWESEATPF